MSSNTNQVLTAISIGSGLLAKAAPVTAPVSVPVSILSGLAATILGK